MDHEICTIKVNVSGSRQLVKHLNTLLLIGLQYNRNRFYYPTIVSCSVPWCFWWPYALSIKILPSLKLFLSESLHQVFNDEKGKGREAKNRQQHLLYLKELPNLTAATNAITFYLSAHFINQKIVSRKTTRQQIKKLIL